MARRVPRGEGHIFPNIRPGPFPLWYVFRCPPSVILGKIQRKAAALFLSQQEKDFARCAKRKAPFIAGNIATESTPPVLNVPMIPSSKYISPRIGQTLSISTVELKKAHAHLAKCNSRPRENAVCYSTDINISLDDVRNIELPTKLSWQEIRDLLIKSTAVPRIFQPAFLPGNMDAGKSARHKTQNVSHCSPLFLTEKVLPFVETYFLNSHEWSK